MGIGHMTTSSVINEHIQTHHVHLKKSTSRQVNLMPFSFLKGPNALFNRSKMYIWHIFWYDITPNSFLLYIITFTYHANFKIRNKWKNIEYIEQNKVLKKTEEKQKSLSIFLSLFLILLLCYIIYFCNFHFLFPSFKSSLFLFIDSLVSLFWTN